MDINTAHPLITQATFPGDEEKKQIVADAGGWLTIVCHSLAMNAGWWIDPATNQDVRTWPPHLLKLWVGTKIALIHSEASEALEGHRKDRMDDHLPDVKQIEAELADVVIRVFDLAGGLGFNLGETIVKKLVFNATRPDHKLANRAAEGGKAY